MRKCWLYLLTATALVSCTSEGRPDPSTLDASVSLPPCTDADGDGFGLGCAAGLDCDDADAASTNECRACAEHETGCDCDGSIAEEPCYLHPVDVGGRPVCQEGTRFCRDGAWTSCQGLAAYELPGTMSGGSRAPLITGPVVCNPCNPSCYSTTDTPGPGDIATGGTGVVYAPVPGGVTLPSAIATCDTSAVAAELAAGYAHTCVRRNSGAVVCWGWNGLGQLGDGTTTNRLAPTAVVGLSDAVEVAPGGFHTCARRASGAVVCWGWNAYGELGDGTTTQRTTPVAVPGLTDAVEIASGFWHTCARRATGAVECWGYNGYGQLGIGSTTNRATPTVVPGLTDAVELSGGGYHTCARRSSGAVACWGWNGIGQLGDGTYTSRYAPTAVIGGLGDAVEISTRQHHTCARRSSGAVVCWGGNGLGQTGNGASGTSYVTPTAVSGLTDAVQISAGQQNTCARRAGGTVMCWGWNNQGQLGDGTFTDRLLPTPVSGLTAVAQISAGDSHACARRTTGEVLCWGYNWGGQVGDGTIVSRPTPTAVPTVTPTCTGALVDTDGDGVPDLYDAAPTNPAVTGYAGGFFHVLPLGATALDPLVLSVQIRTADIYFLMDTTGSMGGEIDNLKASLTTTVIPSILTAIPDAWFGVGRHDDYPIVPYGYAPSGDVVFQHLQDMTSSIAAVSAAVGTLNLHYGYDWPESQSQALWAVATGAALGPYAPAHACPAGRFGYPCFRPGTVPIVILLTDAPFHNGPQAAYDYSAASFGGGGVYYALPGPTAAGTPETTLTARAIGDVTSRSAAYSGSTCGMGNHYSGTCGAGSAGDAVFSFTLTATRHVVIDTGGSSFDTSLSLWNSGLGLITCNDDAIGLQSRIELDLPAGTYYIFVDGWSTSCGNYLLNLRVGTPAVGGFAAPTWPQALTELNARGIKVIVIETSGGDPSAIYDANALCTGTGTVTSTGAPLRYSISSAGTGLGPTIGTAVRDLANYSRLDITGRANDNPATVGFDERTFVSSIAAISYPAGRCTGITGGVQFNQCLPGTTVNFQVNFTGVVAATAVPQRFDFTIDVLGNGTNILSTVPVTIIIPPVAPTYPVSGTYFRDFDSTARCLGTEVARWRALSWTATYPAGTSITWTAAGATTLAGLATATSITFSSPTTPSPQDIGDRLVAAGLPATLPFMRIRATLFSSPDRLMAPTLSAFNVIFECVPGE